ncbi:MAG TPA: hypothetical protein DCL77_12210 [Prolixibacteraceae bacterium]|nr:hypothetical protein [Prolixibacteraceae bacterium]
MGCGQDVVENIQTKKTFKIGEESTFLLQEIFTSTDGLYTLKIKTINDSRCPKGVECFWQGEVVLKGEWTNNTVKSYFELHSVVKTSEKQPPGFTIQIVDVKPYPEMGGTSFPFNTIVTLRIEKNNTKLDTVTFSPSMKGWELYSWPHGSDWNYSILMGTNRAKTYQEVVANTIAVVGKDSLKMLLDKFPAKEEILWIGKHAGDDWVNLSLPDANTVNEIKNYCQQKDLVLSLIN